MQHTSVVSIQETVGNKARNATSRVGQQWGMCSRVVKIHILKTLAVGIIMDARSIVVVQRILR